MSGTKARRGIAATLAATATVVCPGCILGNRPTFVHTGTRPEQITFYLDGAGNFGFGKESVPLGLADGGYEGHVRHYIWTSYLGPVADQIYLSHNRREGMQLAEEIEKHLDLYPTGHVNVIALSAGTGVAVFALETLRPTYSVDNVILLSSSLSSDYDLTRALRRVRGSIYFFWSPDDPILEDLVPMLRTVDGSRTATPAGIWGARLPRGAPPETVRLYQKQVVNRRWSPSIASGPFKLRHAGSINRGVIRQLVAPIVVAKPPDRSGSPIETATSTRPTFRRASPAPPVSPTPYPTPGRPALRPTPTVRPGAAGRGPLAPSTRPSAALR